MSHGFDKEYWEQHWGDGSDGPGSMRTNPPNPYLAPGTTGLDVGTALDAGCGAGAEAIWLATQGWHVTAVDISSQALRQAAERAVGSGAAGHIEWVEADLTVWEPDSRFDLVTTHYAHPAMPQLDFYGRIARWVAPGGTLLIVGHLHGQEGAGGTHGHGHGHGKGHGDGPPEEASVTTAAVTQLLDGTDWQVVTAEEHQRSVGGGEMTLHDVVVRATRLAP